MNEEEQNIDEKEESTNPEATESDRKETPDEAPESGVSVTPSSAHASELLRKVTVDPADTGAVRHQLRGMYQSWFLEYASYVILERAVPHVDDGLKPVQRRILHSMKTLDDGRFNKVANIVGNTMQYHPARRRINL